MGELMPNNLPSVSSYFATALSNKLGTEISTAKINSLLTNDSQKNLNYEILYKFLESSVEEFILVNNGNPLVDDFRQKILNKLSGVLNILMSNNNE
jgi:hypothetical protein